MDFAVRTAFDEGPAAFKDGRFVAAVANSAADSGELAVTNVIALLRGEDLKKAATPRGTADMAPLHCDPETD